MHNEIDDDDDDRSDELGTDAQLARTRWLQLSSTSHADQPRHTADRSVRQGSRQTQVLLDTGRWPLGGWSVYAATCDLQVVQYH